MTTLLARAAALALLLAVAPAVAGVTGSWSASAPPLRLSLPGKVYRSAPLSAADRTRVAGGALVAVSWRYRLPPGVVPDGWLCGGEHCVALAEQRGRTTALAGLPASAPLTLRFALRPGQKALVVEDIQLLVDYRRHQ